MSHIKRFGFLKSSNTGYFETIFAILGKNNTYKIKLFLYFASLYLYFYLSFLLISETIANKKNPSKGFFL